MFQNLLLKNLLFPQTKYGKCANATMFETEVSEFSDQNRLLRTARERIDREIAVVTIGGLESGKDTLDFGVR